jgi:hypothetical protein
MAGDWIKMRVNLVTDPAVKAMARALKIDAFAVVGRLHVFWSWADAHADDGSLPLVTREDIDEETKMPGFAAQLVAVGWLAGDDGSLSLPRFDRHNGESAKRRVLETEKKRRQRAPAACPVSVPENEGQKGDINGTKAGLEKRREEKSKKTGTAPVVTAPASDSEWLDSLKANTAYSHVDVDREHGKMLVWCNAHKKHATRKRFIAWLNRCEPPMLGMMRAAPLKPFSPEPDDWRAFLNQERPESVYAEGGEHAGKRWAELDRSVQGWIISEMRKTNAANYNE